MGFAITLSVENIPNWLMQSVYGHLISWLKGARTSAIHNYSYCQSLVAILVTTISCMHTSCHYSKI